MIYECSRCGRSLSDAGTVYSINNESPLDGRLYACWDCLTEVERLFKKANWGELKIAEAAAVYLCRKNAGQGNTGDGSWMIDCGMLDALHDIYSESAASNKSLKCFVPGENLPKATRIRHAVLNALGNTQTGKHFFECRYVRGLYPGIVNGISRVFVLRKEFRQ